MPGSSAGLQGQWLQALAAQIDSAYMRTLADFLRQEKRAGKVIYPPSKQIFRAMHLTPLESVRCVILGQDPYHGPGQAEGLCFSVPAGVAIPPSLRNILLELQTDLRLPSLQASGSLEAWARQGVLLLNRVLTVESGQAASHQGRGWEQFTDAVLALLNQQQRPIVFMLWGRYAQQKATCITAPHKILQAPHPSPLSAHRGFLGCRHFSQCNGFLRQQGLPEIDWQAIAHS